MTDTPDLHATMQDAIAAGIQKVYPGDVVTRFVLTLETLDAEDGRRSLIRSATPGLSSADALGMMEWAKMQEQAEFTARLLSEEDDGE